MQGFYNCNHFFNRVNQKIPLPDFFFPFFTIRKIVALDLISTVRHPPPGARQAPAPPPDAAALH
jgi:hypothetical protein